METIEQWIIIDVIKQTIIYGIDSKSMVFSKEYIAKEVATKLFRTANDYIVVCLNKGDNKI